MVAVGSTVGITKATGAPQVTIDHEKHDKAWEDFHVTGLNVEEYQMLSAKLLKKHDTIYKLDFELALSFHGQEQIEHYAYSIFYKDYVYSVDYYTQHLPDQNARIVVKRIEREDIERYRAVMALYSKEFS